MNWHVGLTVAVMSGKNKKQKIILKYFKKKVFAEKRN
jgi:hypothetical protein